MAIYAAKFEGVKRAGPRTRRFARDGWLADRKPANEPTDGPMPASAVDVDADGKVEFIANESIRRAKGASFDQFDSLEVPFLDCGC